MKKLKTHLLILYVVLFSLPVLGQDKPEIKNNIVDITIGGNGLFISTNYSRIILKHSSYFINASAGVGTILGVGGITLPHQLTFNFGKKSSFFEVGFGGSYWNGKTDESGFTETATSYQLSPIIGWRKNFNSNLVFRAYASPMIHISGEYFVEDYAFVPFGGVSLGYSF